VKHRSERRCKASNKRGEPCRATIVGAGGYCPAHAAGGRDMRELGRLGGQKRGRKQEEPGDRLERIAHAAIEELLVSPGNATARASAARLVVDKLSASSSLSMELARRAAFEEMTAQMKAEMPAARAKVERLIESRTEARARELTAELEKRTAQAEARLAEFTAAPAARSQSHVPLGTRPT